LPARATTLLTDSGTEAFVSVASLWEIAIKNGRRPGAFPPVADVRAVFLRSGFAELPITADALTQLATLPPLHMDPFDRLLIVIAFAEAMHLLTADRQIAAYDPGGRTIIID
jgi:PIN domain nuclease of toxin-antitoxin system